PINRARRNGQEGHSWNEIEAKGKIDLNRLSKVKIFTPCDKDATKVFWIDNIRVMQEDAAKPKLKVDLPAGAMAFDFGAPGVICPGFQGVSTKTMAGGDGKFGLVDAKDVSEGGEGWPDLLTGTFLIGPKIVFQTKLPNGSYKVWVNAGKILDGTARASYSLQINDVVLCDEHPSAEDYFGEKYYFRFLHTEYSLVPHALWHNYIEKMFPAQTAEVEVKNGLLTLTAVNHFVGGLIVLPAKADMAALATQIETKRIESFEKTYFAKPVPVPAKLPGDGDVVLWQPGRPQPVKGAGMDRPVSLTEVGPTTFPTAGDRNNASLSGSGALGERVVLNLAALTFTMQHKLKLEVTDLKGPGVIPASAIQGFHQSYRSNGEAVSEMCVVPGLTCSGEPNITQCFWLWFQIPADAAPGTYTTDFRFSSEHGLSIKVPVQFEVYPFALDTALPYSFGMYGWAPYLPYLTGAAADAREDAVSKWARAIGLNARTFNGPKLESISDTDVKLTFDSREVDSAKRNGFGVNPGQVQIFEQLGLARAISRKQMPIPAGKPNAPVDSTPGIEFTEPNFKPLWLKAMTKYKTWLDAQNLPYAVLAVDEPREVPNPWNRNFADTCRYCDWMKEVGLRSFVNMLGDTGNGLDYTPMVQHLDIVSIHAGPVSQKLVAATIAQKKGLWWYNTGMDRFSWGFFNWRTGSQGRWEWHFCDAGADGLHGYPGAEWYNPFTNSNAFAMLAPLSVHPAGMLWQSRYFQVAMGINDHAYIYTLEQAIAANKAAGHNLDTVAKAEAFLDDLKKQIPMIPGVAGMADISAGALVGKGAEDASMYQADAWRAQIASYLKVLLKK
ncbi:MAG TPA: hypothetical protein VL860_10820, partial [Planctomycetota bacterium]|nr:hypothetical protein [Planctomycetota bacterium]